MHAACERAAKIKFIEEVADSFRLYGKWNRDGKAADGCIKGGIGGWDACSAGLGASLGITPRGCCGKRL